MERFTSKLSSVLYVGLLGVLIFVTTAVVASIAVVVADRIAPGSVGTVFASGGLAGPIDLDAPGARPFFIVVMLIVLALVAGAILPLVGMLKSTAAGDPFVMANVRRLRIIAGVIGAAIVVQIVLPSLLPAALDGIVVKSGGGDVFALLLTLVLAEVFREGVRLREEVEGTI